MGAILVAVGILLTVAGYYTYAVRTAKPDPFPDEDTAPAPGNAGGSPPRELDDRHSTDPDLAATKH